MPANLRRAAIAQQLVRVTWKRKPVWLAEKPGAAAAEDHHFFFISPGPAHMSIESPNGGGHADIGGDDHQIARDGRLGLLPELIPTWRILAGAAHLEHRAQRAFEKQM